MYVGKWIFWGIAGLTLVVLGVSVYLWLSVDVSRTEDTTKASSTDSLRELLRQNGWEQRYRGFLDNVGVDIESPLVDASNQPSRSSKSSVVEASLEDMTFMRFSEDGVLLNYGKFISRASKLSGTARVRKSDVLQTAKGLIGTGVFGSDEVEGLRYELDEKYITFIPNRDADPNEVVPIEPDRGDWEMYIGRTYMGIKCLSMVRFTVNIETGEIEDIANLPFFPPESMEENISREEAVGIASKFAGTLEIPTNIHEVFKELTHIGDPFEQSLFSTPKSVLCWVVRFKVPEGEGHLHPVEVYVDCRSGKVRGNVS